MVGTKGSKEKSNPKEPIAIVDDGKWMTTVLPSMEFALYCPRRPARHFLSERGQCVTRHSVPAAVTRVACFNTDRLER